jgi:hypothetical protein
MSDSHQKATGLALIEAKNSDNRVAVRQAIGQLYDYRGQN